MRFRDTNLYSMLKQALYTTDKLHQFAVDYVPEPVRGVSKDVFDIGNMGAGTAANVGRETASRVRAVSDRASSVTEDAGLRLGHTLGDMFGKLNLEPSEYEDADIVQILNDKEEIALLERETARLKRLARIQFRKRQRIKDMTTKALRSPFI